MQFGPETCVAKLVSLNLVSLKEPTTHISRFIPSIRDSKAPFIFVWQVRGYRSLAEFPTSQVVAMCDKHYFCGCLFRNFIQLVRSSQMYVILLSGSEFKGS